MFLPFEAECQWLCSTFSLPLPVEGVCPRGAALPLCARKRHWKVPGQETEWSWPAPPGPGQGQPPWCVCPCVRAYVRVCMHVSCSASHMLCIANVIGSSSAPTHCPHVYRRWLQVQCVLVATTSLRVVYDVLANCLN